MDLSANTSTSTATVETSEPSPAEKFYKSLTGLLKFMLRIMRERESNRISNTPNPVIVSLTKYRDVVEDEGSENITSHIDYFLEIYSKNRRDICRGYLNDHWLRRNDSSAFFTFKGKKISLSLIYDISCTIRDKAERDLEGVPGAIEGNPSLVYPEVFLLHLYRIFRESITISSRTELKSDLETINKNIVKLEELLSLRPVDPKNDTTQKDLALPNTNTNGNNPASVIAELLGNLNMGKGQFDAGSIFNMIGGLTANMDPRMKAGLDELASEVKGKDLMSAASILINKVTAENPEMAETVKKTFGGVLTLATSDNSNSPTPVLPAPASSGNNGENKGGEVEYEL